MVNNQNVFAGAKFENPWECTEIPVTSENPDVRGTNRLPEVPVGKPTQITVRGSWSERMNDYPIPGQTDPIVHSQDIDSWDENIERVGGGTTAFQDPIDGAKNPMRLNEIL